MNAIVFHKWHMVDAWRTDNRELIHNYNSASRTAVLKSGGRVMFFIVDSLNDLNKIRGFDFDTVYVWHEVKYLYWSEVAMNVRCDSLKTLWTLENAT